MWSGVVGLQLRLSLNLAESEIGKNVRLARRTQQNKKTE
jgi:hypothetical protein